MKKKLVILSIGMLPLLAAHAQEQDTTLVRTVVVENQYNPTVMDASKINVLPKVEEPTVPKTHIDYATSLRPVSAWNYQAMQPIVKDWKTDAAYRGYLRAGYGNNGNVDTRLGYLWDISKKDRLKFGASLDGWNGDLASLYDNDWESRLYNTKIGLDYRHIFKRIDLRLGGNFRSQVFNYVKNEYFVEDEIYYDSRESLLNKQHQTLVNAYVGFASTDENMLVQFDAEIGFKSFKEKYPIMLRESANKETNFYVIGDVWTQNKNGSRLGMDLRFDNYTYASTLTEDWCALDLNPYFFAQSDEWKIRLGAHADWMGGNHDKVYISPDLKVEYIFSQSYVLFAKAEGGRKLSSLYELIDITPYSCCYEIKPTYISLDAALGLKASPSNGWWFLVSGGYQIRKNDICLYLGQSSPLWSVDNIYGKNHVLYGNAELKYDYKDLVNFSLSGTYYHWDWKNDNQDVPNLTEYALSLKPELEMNANIGFKPVQGLWINIGYDYIKYCNDICGDAVNNLSIEANYALIKNLDVFVKVNNLLNKEYIRSCAYPTQKLNFLGGLSLRF